MFYVKYFILVAMLLFSGNKSHAQKSMYKRNNSMFGPFLGYGLGFGKNDLIMDNISKNLPGSSVNFGFSYYTFLNSKNTIGATLGFAQNNWGTNTQDIGITLLEESKYRMKDYQLMLPIELTQYFSPYRNRWFASFNIAPTFLVQKNMHHTGITAEDSASGFVFNYTKDYSRINASVGAKFGTEWDLDINNSIRIFAAIQAFQNKSNLYGKTKYINFALYFQYFWTN